MAGYNGYSKSNNAVEAERNGRFPASIAARMLRSAVGCTMAEAKLVVTAAFSGEWHHSSKYYNRVAYYDVPQLVLAYFDRDTDWSDDDAIRSYIIGCMNAGRRVDLAMIDQTILGDEMADDWTDAHPDEVRRAELARMAAIIDEKRRIRAMKREALA